MVADTLMMLKLFGTREFDHRKIMSFDPSALAWDNELAQYCIDRYRPLHEDQLKKLVRKNQMFSSPIFLVFPAFNIRNPLYVHLILMPVMFVMPMFVIMALFGFIYFYFLSLKNFLNRTVYSFLKSSLLNV